MTVPLPIGCSRRSARAASVDAPETVSMRTADARVAAGIGADEEQASDTKVGAMRRRAAAALVPPGVELLPAVAPAAELTSG